MKKLIIVFLVLFLVAPLLAQEEVIETSTQPKKFVTSEGIQYWPLLKEQRDKLVELVRDFDNTIKALTEQWRQTLINNVIWAQDMPKDSTAVVLDIQNGIFVLKSDLEQARTRSIKPPAKGKIAEKKNADTEAKKK